MAARKMQAFCGFSLHCFAKRVALDVLRDPGIQKNGRTNRDDEKNSHRSGKNQPATPRTNSAHTDSYCAFRLSKTRSAILPATAWVFRFQLGSAGRRISGRPKDSRSALDQQFGCFPSDAECPGLLTTCYLRQSERLQRVGR